MTQIPPEPPISNYWTDLDLRTQTAARAYAQQNMGVARPRSLTVTIPLCGLTPPVVGYYTSFALFQRTRFVGWMLNALTPGQIEIDLQVSFLQTDPATPPAFYSIIDGNAISIADPNTPSLPPTPIVVGQERPALNGYTAANFNTGAWFTRDVTPPAFIHVFIDTADAAITMCTLGLLLMDLQGKTLQV